ncbi:MAG: glycosyltransferase family 2 protein [Mariprofundaceae bacterium]|nr:glycosyltransferase family 2 protein [Mariprofundaceae bacterium]
MNQKHQENALPLVSIALPVFNGAATLAVAIRSILQQSFENWELIILNDASTDHSLDVMKSFQDKRIRLVEGSENIGLSARLNMAVDLARGLYFARMDQDDISYPMRIEKQLHFLQAHTDIDLLATAPTIFKGEGQVLGRWPISSEHEEICAQPWNGFHFPHPTWMGKTTWFQKNRYDSRADGAEDQDLLLRSYQVSRFACLDEPLLAYYEGTRPLKKMLRARRIFVQAYMRQFMLERKYALVLRVACLLSLKMLADIVYALCPSLSTRNTLTPLSKLEESRWEALWHHVNYLDAK